MPKETVVTAAFGGAGGPIITVRSSETDSLPVGSEIIENNPARTLDQ